MCVCNDDGLLFMVHEMSNKDSFTHKIPPKTQGLNNEKSIATTLLRLIANTNTHSQCVYPGGLFRFGQSGHYRFDPMKP